MWSIDLRRCLVLTLAILILAQAVTIGTAASALEPARTPEAKAVEEWREASPMRVIIRSTADWGRILFDDLNGTNSNGVRIRSVVGTGWLEGRREDDQLYAGRKIAWPDTEYDRVIVRTGDMVACFKGLGDFHYTEVYADLILEINVELPRVYFWLMTGGNGTTTFEIVSQDTGGTIWRDIVVGSGETQQVKRVMSPQPFFRPGRTESTIVVTWLTIAIAAIIFLNLPILEVLSQHLPTRKRSRVESGGKKHAGKRNGE